LIWSANVLASDVYELAIKGAELSASGAARLEARLEQEPEDVEKRTILLGYYLVNQRQDESIQEKRRAHVLWLIENSPEADVLSAPYGALDPIRDTTAYGQAKQLWEGQLEKQPENLKLLENASKFFLLHEPKIAKQSLEKARALKPKDPKWPDALGQFYFLKVIRSSGKAKIEAGEKALEQLEIAYELSDDDGRDSQLGRIAKAAMAAKNTDKAKEYAMKMLAQDRDDWNSGNNIHDGNAILGQVALLSDDVDEAKRRLLEAGKTHGSPQLGSFGPNMTLAKELLKRGEKETVLEYFDLCSEFWEMGGDRLEQWSAKVKAGKRPAFGGNLNY